MCSHDKHGTGGLSASELATLLRLVRRTAEHELDCDQCLTHMPELAEAGAGGRPASELLRQVEQHLGVCPECREEFEALRAALRPDGEPGTPPR